MLTHMPRIELGRSATYADIVALPHLPDTAYFDLAPDWVCEVLSPSTEWLDRDKKLRVYASAGVWHVWLVDPLARSLEVLRRAGAAWTRVATHVDRDVACEEPGGKPDRSAWNCARRAKVEHCGAGGTDCRRLSCQRMEYL